MNRSPSTSIQRQLQLFFVLTLGFTVLVMGGVWIGYNQVLLEREAERVLIVESDIIGAAARPALMFNDQRMADALLQSMQLDPDISVVKLFTYDGESLYTYVVEEGTAAWGEQVKFRGSASTIYRDGKLHLYRIIAHKGSPVGVIYLESRLNHLKESQYTSILTVIMAMLGCLLLGLLLAFRMQKRIAAPITDLAKLMRKMGEDNDYSLRTESVAYNRETEELLLGFNHMAEEIQHSFQMIEEHHLYLQQSEKRFRDIVELAPIPVIITHPSDGHVLFYNQEAARIFNVNLKSDEQFSAPDFYRHPEQRQRLMDRLEKQGEFHGQELEVQGEDGKSIWISLSMSVMHFESEPAIFSAFVDITEQKSVELMLARNNEALEQRVLERTAELQSTLDNMIDTYYRVDVDGTVKWASASVLSLLGYQTTEIAGVSLKEFSVDGRGFPSLAEALKQHAGAVINHRIQMKHKDGHAIWASISAHQIVDDQGEKAGIEGVVRDITQQVESEVQKQEMEQKMAHVQRLESLGVLAGGIAHDFNNILAGIMGNAELAELNALENMPVTAELKNIVISSIRAADLCKQMLAYSGQGTMVRTPVSISALVEETVQLIDVSISKNISLTFDLQSHLPGIMADKTQMQQVILNLITNASEAIGEDESGMIHVRTGSMFAGREELVSPFIEGSLPEGEYAYLDVADDGCGMDEFTLNKIFDPFFTTKFTGRGLGMSATLGIVRSHDGSIQVESEQGRGTRFRILFPVHAELVCEEHTDHAIESAILPERELTILVIDDEVMVRAIVEKMLHKLGCQVLFASDGHEGLEQFSKNRGSIDAVLLDMTMPKMGGKETLIKLRKMDIEVPVIICSGYRNENISEKFEGVRPAAFLQKPFSLKSLQHVMGECFSTP